ncbi:amidase family protein, partial [Nocardioides sp.]|uniref:amidase family protein n=1 Tax=Nocardioides sp. TaxID=35761 RepID=UPI0039E4F3E6
MRRIKTRALGATVALTLGAGGLALTGSPTATAAADPTGALFLEPYYTEGDLTGDSQITQADLDLLAAAIGRTSADAGWADVSAADLDGDSTISVGDLADLAQRVIYDDGTFELIEAGALEMQKAMNAGVITSVQLTQDYLDRIAAYDKTVVDQSTGGRALNSIISTSDVALEAAAESDAARAANGGPRSMLDGIPVLLKDNYDTEDMPTSAGCGCWVDNQTTDDATMTAGLREAGAIILGKASMDEFAYGFTSQFSALSEAGQSLYVASPYNTANTAGGSSGGTGAAISANLGGIGFGTDTGGSIRVPSSYNQLVGLRPTVGLTSREGIIPLALSQDTGGPMARSVSDIAIALDAVAGTDDADSATAETDGYLPESYTSYLDPDALAGKHFAYLTSMVPPASGTDAQQAARRIFLDAVADLEAAGATVEEIDPTTLSADPDTGITATQILAESSGSTNEFKHDLNLYIESHLDSDVEYRSLSEILASGRYTPSYASVYAARDAITQETYDAWIGTEDAPGTHTTVLRNGQAYITDLLDTEDLDALIYPTGLPYSSYAQNMRLSPNTGMPAITVPMGQTTADETLPGAGVNLEFLGRDYAEGDLLAIAYSFEQETQHRTTPALYPALDGDVVAGPGTDTDAPGNGAVSVTGPSTTPAAGETFTVTVSQSAADLYAYRLSLGFDPSAVELVSTGPAGTTGTSYTTSSTGSVTVTHTKLGSSPAAEGETTLTTLTFKALKAGSASVTVTGLTTVNSAGVPTTVAIASDAAEPATLTVGKVSKKPKKAAVVLTVTVNPAGVLSATGKK